MALVYFDSSAFVKLVIDEHGSELAAQLWDGCDGALSSRLAYPEVCAAVAAAARNSRLTPRGLVGARHAWTGLWNATQPVEVTESIAFDAGKLSGELSLRAADAVHLASALALRAPGLVFATWDRRLRTGAAAAGLLIAPVTPAGSQVR